MKLLKCLGIPLFWAFSTFAQKTSVSTVTIDVTGKVTNDKGEALANANVTIKDGKGTITNAKGQYSLKNVLSTGTLQVSYIGYTTQQTPIKGLSNINFTLSPSDNILDRVVVQAYGVTSDRLRTGSIEKITSEQISRQPVMNVLNVLQGQTPGAVVTNTSGYASGVVKIEIRGRNTINPGFPADPLYIVDGVPLTILDLQKTDSYAGGSRGVTQSGLYSPANGQSPLFSINPSDIESIEVLKDADATALYGSRASNGVILITTKKGKMGKSKFELRAYTGISKILKRYPMLSTREYVAMRKEALTNDGLPIDASNAPDLAIWDTTRYRDWQKYTLGNVGKSTNIEADLSGGDARTSFRISMNYQNVMEILRNTGTNQRGSVNFNINNKSADQRLSIGLSGIYSISFVNTIFVPNALNLPPNTPSIWDENENLNYGGWLPLDNKFVFYNYLQPYTSKTNFLNGSFVIGYEILKGLSAKANFGYNNFLTQQTSTSPIAAQNPVYNSTGKSTFGNSISENLIIEPQIEYNTALYRGKLNVLFGGSYQSNTGKSSLIVGEGYTNDALLGSVNAAPIRSVSNQLSKYKYTGVFARINYNWENKYIVNLNARRDGSTKFGPGRQFGNFGSIGAAWIFSEEPWIKKHVSFLSFGKFRTSYGTVGGDQIGNYEYLSRWQFGLNTAIYNGSLTLVPLTHFDSLIHWQVNRKVELAAAFGFLKDRIMLNISYYRNRCSNQLVSFPTPNFTGFPSVTSNSPAEVQNKGWEFIINAEPFKTLDFKWSARLNIAINRNKLVSYPNFSQSPYFSTLAIGKPLNIAKVLHTTGVNPQTGLYQFEDLNKDGQISTDFTGRIIDDRYIVELAPKYDGGLSNSFIYRNWQLDFLFYFKKQIGLNAIASLSTPGDITNQPTIVLRRWQKPGDITDIAKFTASPNDDSYYQFRNSDGYYTNASFMRLQNFSLSYTLSEKILKRAGINNLRIYVQAQNLFVITNYEGPDPEIQDFIALPLPKIITAGISCNF
jgi:TonB-linked SusC/RagA family outer membrane protein